LPRYDTRFFRFLVSLGGYRLDLFREVLGCNLLTPDRVDLLSLFENLVPIWEKSGHRINRNPEPLAALTSECLSADTAILIKHTTGVLTVLILSTDQVVSDGKLLTYLRLQRKEQTHVSNLCILSDDHITAVHTGTHQAISVAVWSQIGYGRYYCRIVAHGNSIVSVRMIRSRATSSSK